MLLVVTLAASIASVKVTLIGPLRGACAKEAGVAVSTRRSVTWPSPLFSPPPPHEARNTTTSRARLFFDNDVYDMVPATYRYLLLLGNGGLAAKRTGQRSNHILLRRR